ncbi:MAG: aminoacyl-tRNA hydrolase [Thermodesulfobacteriota bacterium]|nr:aminoacyl-tRNA hydrolase [Thermodesulfobacteriota bacterium]
MPEDRFRLIVGLGNPGEKYRHARHNMGFMVVDRLARAHGILLGRRKFNVLFGRGKVGSRQVILAKPMSYMNLSGPAARDLAFFFKLEMQDILVIHDDIDLVFGQIKIKEKGGNGGHNGVKSLIEALGTGEFTRLRVGIGRPETRQRVRAYVLAGFDAQQETLLEDVIATAQDAAETILFKGVPEAMNRFHGKTISERNVGRRL